MRYELLERERISTIRFEHKKNGTKNLGN